ncbi:MAG TPA: hypothetical protein VNB22_01400 [Pyrinomonadaceae bacterium]|nr:hypothetical protein [Pyrinomonadaceae bacterium]
MRQELFTVDDVFKMEERRGIVVVGDHQADFLEPKLGSAIVMILPDSTERIKKVGGIDIFSTVSGIKKIGILVKNLTKEDVPVGTKIFLKT